MAYCRSKKHLVQKFAQELIYYGYAGLQCHFTYRSLLDATKGTKSGLDVEANKALMTKLYKFAKMAEVFKKASLSEPGRALQLKLEDEILAQIAKDEAGINITDWLSRRIINPNDWPYECVIKGADGRENDSLVIQYQKINKIKDCFVRVTSPKKLLTKEPWLIPTKTEYEIGSTYVRAPEGNRLHNCTKPGTDNVMIVNYYPDGEEKTVFVSWKKVAVCFYQTTNNNKGEFNLNLCLDNGGRDCEFKVPKTMLDSASRY